MPIAISFISSKLKKQCDSAALCRQTFGEDRSKALMRRLGQIKAANCVADLFGLPGRYHRLREDRDGQFAAAISANFRIIFVPDHEPIPKREDNSIDLSRVTAVQIIGMEDYHGA